MRSYHVYTEKPPAEIASSLAKLERGENRTDHIRALVARHDAAPYLRVESRTAQDRYARDLRDAIEQIEVRTRKRNQQRFEWWIKCRRFDLCNEVLVAWPEDKSAEAVRLITSVVKELHVVGAEAAAALDLRFGGGGFDGKQLYLYEQFDRTPLARHYAGGQVAVTVGQGSAGGPVIVRSDSCRAEFGLMDCWFVAVRSQIEYEMPIRSMSEWSRSIILVNSSLSLREASSSLFVVDGDVEFTDMSRHQCVIIANGSIRAPNRGGARNSFLAAKGDIEVLGDGVFHAGGKVERHNRAAA